MRKQGFKEEADNNLLSPLEDLLKKSLQNACKYCIYFVYRKYNYYEIGIHYITKYTAQGASN